MLTPQPETIYDKNPPIAVREMKMEDVPMASIIEKPKSPVKMAIMKMPPPTPSRPDEKPTRRPIIPVEIRLKGILASSRSLLMFMMLLIVTNNNRQPNIISRILDGIIEAVKPPMAPPIIPKRPNLIPGFTIPSIVLVCL